MFMYTSDLSGVVVCVVWGVGQCYWLRFLYLKGVICGYGDVQTPE